MASSFEERVRLLEQFFLQQLSMYQKKAHFLRVFRETGGMTPKRFQQLARFRAVTKELLINRTSRYLPVALDKEYFDQAHFIKEFKRFMGETPASYLTTDNFQSHFYYPSL